MLTRVPVAVRTRPASSRRSHTLARAPLRIMAFIKSAKTESMLKVRQAWSEHDCTVAGCVVARSDVSPRAHAHTIQHNTTQHNTDDADLPEGLGP
jgi:hypothetical protein